MKKIVTVIGARPQFIKHAPVELALKKYFNVVSIHTGQHYDEKMSKVFFDQLCISHPKYMLSVGSSSHGEQTGRMLENIEKHLRFESPDAVLVYGDTNSTLAGALAASKIHIPLAHIEAGLRSFNKKMPEEINRIITDHVSDFLFTPTENAVNNLHSENIFKGVYNIGDVMFDSLMISKRVINDNRLVQKTFETFILVTLHRPYNTDHADRLIKILYTLNDLNIKIIFPIHPRTNNIIIENNIDITLFQNVEFIEPVSYFELLELQVNAHCIITDSGGIQKESYFLKKKCITIRTETEWSETLKNGWNTLIFNNLHEIGKALEEVPGDYIENLFGDGHAAIKAAKILYDSL